jgi:hypothetical protein
MASGVSGQAMASIDVRLDGAKDTFDASLQALMKSSPQIGCSTTVPRALGHNFDFTLEFKPNDDLVCVVLSLSCSVDVCLSLHRAQQLLCNQCTMWPLYE